MLELGRPGEAGEAMLGWLDDNNLDGLMRAAALLWEGRRFESSLETVQRVLAQAPDSPRAQALEAHLLSSTGRHEEAVERLRRLLKKNPEDVDLMIAMAWSTSRMGDHDEARRWLDRGWEQVAENAGSPQAARTALAAARLELIADHPVVAREWLDRVADPATVGSDYVRLLAEIFRRQEQWREGVSAMARVQPKLEGRAQREAEAVESEFLMRLDDSRAWRRLRPLLEAGDETTVLLGLEGRDLIFARASAFERLGTFDRAAELFRTLVDIDPDDAAAANYLGYMLADRNMDLDEAFDLIIRAVALDPENAAYLDSLGWVHFRRGELEEAERWIRRAIDLGGDAGDGTLYCHLGEILLSMGDSDDGRRYLVIGLDRGCDDQERVRSLLDQSDDDPR
jgi:tetratricopeptide (TPR) repeat protein